MLVAVMFCWRFSSSPWPWPRPVSEADFQRDREIETMHRGKQYIRAIKLYYKKFGAYPPNVDALVKRPTSIRFLRKKYIDPTTGKDEWRPIHVWPEQDADGMGFFGQPLRPARRSARAIGARAAAWHHRPGDRHGSGAPSAARQPRGSELPAQASADQRLRPRPARRPASRRHRGTATSGTAARRPRAAAQSGGPAGQRLGGQTFGGAGIIGFSPTSPKQSILVYKKKNHYNEWEFVYDPLCDRMMMRRRPGPSGQPASSTTSPISGIAGRFGGTAHAVQSHAASPASASRGSTSSDHSRSQNARRPVPGKGRASCVNREPV